MHMLIRVVRPSPQTRVCVSFFPFMHFYMEQNGEKKTGCASGGHKNSSQQVRVGASYHFLHFHMRKNGNKTKKKTEKKTGCASGGCVLRIFI